MSNGKFSMGILFILSVLVGKAQNTNYTELFRTSFQTVAKANFEDTTATLRESHFLISGGYGFTLNEKNDQLDVGLSYGLSSFDSSAEPDNTLNIHDLQVGLSYTKNLGLYWGSTFSLGIGNVSDFQTEATTAYQTNLSALLHYGKRESLIWTFGLLYSDQPFGPWVFPILGVDWQINPDLYFSSILFNNLYLEHALISQRLYWGLDISAVGYSFLLSEYLGEMNSYVTSFSESVPFFPFNYSVFMDYYLANGLVLYLKAGYLATRGFLHMDSDHDRIPTLYDRAIDPAFNVEFGVAFRIRNF